MRLTSFTDYGLRMPMRMASEPERGFSAAERGTMLALPAGRMRLGAITRLLEEDQPLVERLRADGGHCTIDGRCRLQSRLREAEALFLDDLDRSTLADIALISAPAI